MRHRTKMGIKNTASEERVFRLQWLPEDDTLIIERTGVSFGALVFEPFLLVAGAAFLFYTSFTTFQIQVLLVFCLRQACPCSR